MRTYGRQTIYANYTENELLNADSEELYKIIVDVINETKSIHERNKNESNYLRNYLNGKQDIYVDKIKVTRPEINNKTVENWAWAFVEFKKTFLLGKEIQYVQNDDSSGEEIAKLNKYVRYEHKKAKDMLLYEDILCCGRGFRYKNFDKPNDEDEAPFEIINIPSGECEVVYSSQLGNEQLFSYVETKKTCITEGKKQLYDEYTVYLRNKKIVVNNKYGVLQVVTQNINGEEHKEVPILLNEHLITEYYVNQGRISLIEIGKDLFNDINYLESLDKDDMEQFVNAIMVFTNAEVNKNDLNEIRELGAVSISSTENKRASVDLLEQRLNSESTSTYYSRLLNALHQILGVPIASDNGGVIYGDTGKARLTGQGFTSAGIRTESDETMFGMCDMQFMRGVLKICKETPNSGITNLKISTIENKFQRDMSENLLVKTQALMNLYECNIPREIANAIIGLFSDPNAVTQLQNKKFGEQKPKEQNSNNDKINEQNNKKTSIEEVDKQGL